MTGVSTPEDWLTEKIHKLLPTAVGWIAARWVPSGLNATTTGFAPTTFSLVEVTGVGVPELLKLYSDTFPVTSPVASQPPAGSKAIESGAELALNGEPVTDVSAPLVGLTEKTDKALESASGVATNLASGLKAALLRPGARRDVPPGLEKGDPVTAVNTPVDELTDHTETDPSPELSLAANPPMGLKATELGAEPPANGDPVTAE